MRLYQIKLDDRLYKLYQIILDDLRLYQIILKW